MALTTADGSPVGGGPAQPVFVVNQALPPAPAPVPAAGNTAVTIADGANVAQGAKADATAGSDSGTFSLISLVKRLLAKFVTQLPAALGQTTKAGSFPVTLASDQGSLATSPGASSLATYRASVTGLVPDITPTDIFEIKGSASKTIKVISITVSGVATAAAAITVQMIKRSTANTVGTSTAPTPVPLDSNDAAASATLKAYTGDPSLGTPVGVIISRRFTVTTVAGAIPHVPLINLFANSSDKAVILRDVTESLCVGLNGATLTGGLIDIDILWTEE